jgi:hemolysin D
MQAQLLNFVRPERRKRPSPTRATGPDYAALTDIEREFLPHLLEIEATPPSPLERRLLWVIVAGITVLLGWSIFAQMDMVATAPGKFIPDGRVKVIQPMETSVVKAIYVREGQHVKEGDLLIELDPALSEADLASATLSHRQNRLEQTRLVAELGGKRPAYEKDASPEAVQLQEALREARVATYQMKLAAARAAIDEKASAFGAAEAQLKKAQITLEIATEREQKMATLLASNFISRMEYLKNLQELESAKHDLESQRQTVEQQRHGHKQAVEQFNVIQQDWRAGVLTDLDRETTAHPQLKRDKDKAERLNDLKTLRAPVGGYVQAVGVTTLGGVVTPAQNLITIVPENTPLLIEASLSNDDIGYVRVGQKVEIKVDTYPFQKYGILSGTLVWISPDAEPRDGRTNAGQDASNAASDASGQQSTKSSYAYKVHVRPDADSKLVVSSQTAVLQAGMTVQADIKTDRRRVIEFFLSPVVKYMDEGMKVR